MLRRFHIVSLAVLIPSAFLLAAPATAQSYKVEKITAAAPQELAPAVRDALVGEAIRVAGSQGLLCEIWLRKALPAKDSVAQELGIAYGQLAEGTLVGAIRFPAEVKDYRRQRVKAGVYTLRYALTPVDGDHLGVAPQRDFLLASPAAADQNPANITRDAMLDLSRKTTGASHPSPWSLATQERDLGGLPAVVHQDDGDLWVLKFRVPLQAGSANCGTSSSAASALVMALVVLGHAPEA